VPVHGDLIPLNILQQGPASFRIIDWEGLRLDEPEADVATLFKAYRCDAAQQQAFERGYGPGLRPQRLRFRRLLHDLQVAAWRLACQIPVAEGAALEKALAEAREELDWAREALEVA
jgi:thiamine kinase-like enzyme